VNDSTSISGHSIYSAKMTYLPSYYIGSYNNFSTDGTIQFQFQDIVYPVETCHSSFIQLNTKMNLHNLSC